MATIIKEVNLIWVDVAENKNRHWRGIWYDNGTAESQYSRVGYTTQSCEYPSHSILDKKYNEKLKKGYRLVRTVANGTSSTVEVSNISVIARKQIRTNKPELEKLIDRLVKYNIHKITSSTQITFNAANGSFSTPLGIVTSDAIDEARSLLIQIDKIVKSNDYNKSTSKNVFNQYFMLVPQNVGMKLDVKYIFADSAAIQKQNDLLDSLASSFAGIQKVPVVSQIKTIAEEQIFDVELNTCDDDKERNRILKWFRDTNLRTHGYNSAKIDNIYSVSIKDTNNKFQSSLNNITEVWHGTSQANLLSILKSGLKSNPPGTAAITGRLFGDGIYGAIHSSKSLQYTMGRFSGNRGECGWLFVCDFALGKTYYPTTYGGHRASGYDSIWAEAKKTGLRFDELIVPKSSQVRIKYLLEVN